MQYARVVFPLPQDLTFSYAIPDRLQSLAQRGSRVLAPLGERTREGVIVDLMDEPDLPDDSIQIKNLTDCLDDPPTFFDELLTLTKWMAEYYLSSWGEALRCAACVFACNGRADREYASVASNGNLVPTQGR